MQVVASKKSISKEKSCYEFQFHDKYIQILYENNSKSLIEIYINNSLLSKIKKTSQVHKIEFIANDNTHIMEISFKESRILPVINSFLFGLNVKIDEVPLENTIADPNEVIKNTKLAGIAFLALLVLKIIVSFIQNRSIVSLFANIIGNLIYIIPLIMIAYFITAWKKKSFIGSILLLIFSILETIDYFFGISLQMQSGGYILGYSVVIYTAIRISIIIVTINAIKIQRINKK